MSTDLVKKDTDLDMSVFGTKVQVDALRRASFPTLEDSDFIVAMKIAKQYNLDPFAKEIWGWIYDGKTMVVVAYAGYLRIARTQPGFISLETQAVFPKDEFEIDFVNQTILHKMNVKEQVKNDTPIGAWCRLRYLSQGQEQICIKFVRWEEYAKSNVWLKNKTAMICKVAGTVAIREVYGLSGLYIDEEMGHQKDLIDRDRDIPDISQIVDTNQQQ